MNAVNELYLFTKLPSHLFDSGLLTDRIDQLADFSNKYTTFLKLLKSESERLRFQYYIGGANLLICMHLYKIEELESLRQLLSTCFDGELQFGMANNPLDAAKGWIWAHKKSIPIYIYNDYEHESVTKTESIIQDLYKAEYEEPVQADAPQQAKDTLYDLNPDFFREKLADFQKLLSKFKGSVGAFDMVAAQNPEAYQSMLNVIRAIGSIAQFLVESGIIPPEDMVSNMAQDDLRSQLTNEAEGGATEVAPKEQSESSGSSREAPIGTVRQVNIGGRLYTRVKTTDGWHFMNRGQVASEGGSGQGRKPGSLLTGKETIANQNVK